MHVSSGRPHIQTSNQRGRGKEPVVVVGSSRSAVAVNIGHLQTRHSTACEARRASSFCTPQIAVALHQGAWAHGRHVTRLLGVSNLTLAEDVVQAKDLKEGRTHGLEYRKNCIAAERRAVFIEGVYRT